jgi:hypothetical protein
MAQFMINYLILHQKPISEPNPTPNPDPDPEHNAPNNDEADSDHDEMGIEDTIYA